MIGSQTFGKGTVQTIVPLNRGQLKLTQMKFYRISGESNQHRGIIPDILYPDNFDPEVIGESALDGPLPWDTIPATRYPVASRESELITRLNKSHQSRIKNDPDFIYEQSAIAFQRKQAKKEFRSLNEFTRINDKNNTEVFWLGLENQRRKDKGLTTISSLDELDSDLSINQKNPLDSKTNIKPILNSDSEDKLFNSDEKSLSNGNKRNNVNEEISDKDMEEQAYDPDAFVSESGNILIDLISAGR